MIKKKWLLWSLPVLLIILLLFYWATTTANGNIEVQKPQVGSLEVQWKERGYLVAQEEQVLYPPVATKVLEVAKKSGDVVAKGDFLLRLDNRPLQERLAQLEAQRELIMAEVNQEAKVWQVAIVAEEIEQSRLKLAELATERERVEQLVSAGAVPPVELEKIENRIALEQSRLAQAEAQYEQAQVLRDQGDWTERLRAIEAEKAGLIGDLATLEIRAPFSGTISEMNLYRGQLVDPSRPLLNLTGKKDLEIQVDVLHEEVNKVHKGQEVVVSHRGTGKSVQAKVDRIGTRAEAKISPLGLEQRRVPVYITVDPIPEQWLEGFPIDVTFSWTTEESLLIPRSALLATAEGTFLYLMENEEVKQAPVSIGIIANEKVQVLAGLQGDEEIILSPENVKVGQKIKATQLSFTSSE
ncbi:efflux RND transporter periplasmic adaptor subunit [Heliorestis acidaminivorans]|uniref:Efflux RND transporter periplasmic adaptor subunit n=1 Tax=Heliorestis acidaminivorans TaxID=553427 RepID=A0A6I0EVB4_9FIRM|nr:efflux RND transporter periplasmic adaptor subunit [Heliorestis acidaminivorans]KAB2951819.1 efflux RND transporter periplasmic adaptor subunit [Heliorestis acidaminivorans]